jgi:curved DNA-binding protein
MEYKDYYRILGVARDAALEDIKQAYRRAARKYHPDVSKEANAEARFKEVNEAYEVLKDPDKRAAYDRLGSDWQAGEEFRVPPEWAQGFAGGQFSDFFDSLFGGRFGRGGARGGFSMPGEDQHATIDIDLEESYRGATRTLQLTIPRHDERGGVATASRSLKVKIPAGVTAGQRIRVPHQGAPGVGGGPAGDLYLEVRIRPHRLFKTQGKDVYLELPLAPWEAALGTALQIPTLGGPVELKIPGNSQSGRKMRLKGRGLPGTPSGDQYVVVSVHTPPAHEERSRDFYRRMAQEFPFDPRAGLGF